MLIIASILYLKRKSMNVTFMLRIGILLIRLGYNLRVPSRNESLSYPVR